MATLEQRLAEITEVFDSFDDWKERYEYIIDLGDEMTEFPEEFRLDEFMVKGCVSRVWLVGKKSEDGTMIYLGDSDSLFVKGMVGLVFKIYNGLSPKEIVEDKGNFLMDSGLVQNLSPNRVNGAAAMLQKVKDIAALNNRL